MNSSRRRVAIIGLQVAVVGLVVGIAAFVVPFFRSEAHEAPAIGVIRTIGRVDSNLSAGLATLDSGALAYADGPRVDVIDRSGSKWNLVTLRGRSSAMIRDLAVGPDSGVYFSTDANLVEVYQGGLIHPLLGQRGTIDLDNPRGLAALPDGTLYVADLLNDRVLKRSVDGETTQIGSLHMPDDMTADHGGNAYVAAGGEVYKIVGQRLEHVFDLDRARTAASRAALEVIFIAFAPDDDLIVADELGCTIYRVHREEYQRVVGTGICQSSPDGTPVDAATINAPWAVTVTADYRLIFSESGGLLRAVQLTR